LTLIRDLTEIRAGRERCAWLAEGRSGRPDQWHGVLVRWPPGDVGAVAERRRPHPRWAGDIC